MFRFKLIKKSILLLITGCVVSMFTVQAKVVTSIKPIGFIVETIASGVTQTDVLLPDGASPHTYSLKPSDLVKLKSAELIIWIGDDMETFLPNLLSNIDSKKQVELMHYSQVTALLRKGHSHDDKLDVHDHHHTSHGQFDTHIWLSPKIAQVTAQIIHDKLSEIYPEKRSILDKNLKNFIKELKETEQIIAKKFINVQNSGYFVFHDAYGYFEAEFNLNNLGSFTINPSIQPGLRKVYEIQNELKSKHAVCIFREPQFSPAIINKLTDGTNVRVGELDPLGINITVSKDAYCKFLLNITQQFLNCLE